MQNKTADLLIIPEPQRVVVVYTSKPVFDHKYEISVSATERDVCDIVNGLNGVLMGSAHLKKWEFDLNRWTIYLSHQWGPVFDRLAKAIDGYSGAMV